MPGSSPEIERETKQALATPLHESGRAAAQVRKNIKETSWLVTGLLVILGLVLGLVLGWLPFRSDMNHLQKQGDRIEQYLANQQQAAPATPEPSHAPARKGKK